MIVSKGKSLELSVFEAVAQGLIMRQNSFDTSWEVDLSHMSFAVVRTTVVRLFRKIVKKYDEKIHVGTSSAVRVSIIM